MSKPTLLIEFIIHNQGSASIGNFKNMEVIFRILHCLQPISAIVGCTFQKIQIHGNREGCVEFDAHTKIYPAKIASFHPDRTYATLLPISIKLFSAQSKGIASTVCDPQISVFSIHYNTRIDDHPEKESRVGSEDLSIESRHQVCQTCLVGTVRCVFQKAIPDPIHHVLLMDRIKVVEEFQGMNSDLLMIQMTAWKKRTLLLAYHGIIPPFARCIKRLRENFLLKGVSKQGESST